MRKFFLIPVILILLLCEYIFAFDMSQIVAYPVPFNFRKATNKYITIDNRSGGPAGTFMINVKVYDINGDDVFSRSFSSFANVKWNGYNNNNKRVMPGLYILKITVEDPATGDHGEKIFRLLINH